MSRRAPLIRTIAKRSAALATVALMLTGCMTLDQDREAQRPALPETHAVMWTPYNRLYRSVALDYVTGMDQHSYLFGSANQSAFRPLLQRALAETGLLAPPGAPLAARYALQIEFKDLEGDTIGGDFSARSLATYRIVNRATGEVVFDCTIPASFNAQFPGLNEHDAASAYLLSSTALKYTGLGALDTIIDAGSIPKGQRDNTWRGFYYASAASVLFGPVVVGLDYVLPTNYVARANFWGERPTEPVLGARHGVLSTDGIGARDGGERRTQADAMMMGQSLTKFIIALGDKEHVAFTTTLPCVENAEVAQVKVDLEVRGLPWQTDDCMMYQRQPDANGRTFTSYR